MAHFLAERRVKIVAMSNNENPVHVCEGGRHSFSVTPHHVENIVDTSGGSRVMFGAIMGAIAVNKEHPEANISCRASVEIGLLGSERVLQQHSGILRLDNYPSLAEYTQAIRVAA